MPLKDLDKLTVVKLRAELIARGLDSKGNKPFLVERLRFALDQEEKNGGIPEMKIFHMDEQMGDTSMEQENADTEDLNETAEEDRPDSGREPQDSDLVSEEKPDADTNGMSEGTQLFACA